MIVVGADRPTDMSKVTCQISISLDGFVAGPNQSLENPIGEGGLRLHEWVFATASWRKQQGMTGGERSLDSDVASEVAQNVGAYIMGRKMFGGGEGPVFVLTHHERESLPMQGGTTFTFVTTGVRAALEQARQAAGDKDIMIAGGAHAIQQFIEAGLLDELYLHIVPVVLGAGERLLENVGDPKLELVKVITSPAVTHVKYRILHS